MFGRVAVRPGQGAGLHLPIRAQLEALAELAAEKALRAVGLSNETP